MTNEQIVPGDDFKTIVVPRKDGTGDPQVSFTLDGDDETVENLKLILSTERVDDFLLELDPLTGTRGFGAADDAEAAKPVTDDWFTKDLRVHIVPQLNVGRSAAGDGRWRQDHDRCAPRRHRNGQPFDSGRPGARNSATIPPS